MFSEDFFEIIKKTEDAYKAQNVSEIVNRAGRKEEIIILILTAFMIASALLTFKFLNSFLNIVFSIIFAILTIVLALYLQRTMNSENILFYKDHSELENAADYFVKNLDTEKVSPKFFDLIEEYYENTYLKQEKRNSVSFYFSVILVPILVSFLCYMKGNIFMLIAGCLGFLVIPGIIEFVFYVFDSKKIMARNICSYLKYEKLIRRFNEINK